jgi:hypothetical protein
MADGGIVSNPTTARVGEAGREAIIPLESKKGERLLNQGIGGKTEIHIHAGVFVGNEVTAMETAKVIGDLLSKARSKGVIGKI